ncbi:TPA: glycosyltransferase, partial [Escherichia coli]|nr:glycosyltransferase [Escherichia coli]
RTPLVSVYIPTHNRANLLKKAVESVLRQTYPHVEILICDDGSTDNTEEVVNQLIERNSGKTIIYLKNEQARGACFSRNRCLQHSKGDFVTGLDDDDEFTPERIKAFIDFAHAKQINFLTSALMFHNGRFYKRDNSVAEEITFEDMGYKNVIGNQVFAPRNMFLDVGGFDETFPAWQDYDMWFRMIKKFGPCYRLNDATYIMNVNEQRKRITTGGNAHQGYQKFIFKHKKELSTNQLKSLYLRDIINRNDTISISDILKCGTVNTALEISKYWLRKNISGLDKIIALARSKKTS